MKKIILNSQLGLFILSLLIFVSCGNDTKQKPIDPGFVSYISSFSSGVVSNNETIIIRLTQEKADVEPNTIIDKELFSFLPNIEGNCYWINKRTIEFRPENALKSGLLYNAKFYLGKVNEVPDKFQVFEFQFQTIKQAVFVNYEGTESYSTSDLTWQRSFGKVVTSDFANSNDIEKIITATQSGNKLKISWKHDDLTKTHNFSIDSISRGAKQSEVYLEWDAENIDSDQSGDLQIEIPAIDDFKILNVTVDYQPEQCVNIFFSDPINPNQNLTGLISFANNADSKFIIEKNLIKMFPRKNLTSTTSIIVNQAVKNVMDYPLKSDYTQEIQFSSIKPKVELIGDGVIIPNTNGLLFPFKAVNLKAVNVKIIKIFEDNVAQFFQTNQFDGKQELKRVGRIVYKKEVQLTSPKAIDYANWNTFSLELSDLIKVEEGAIYRVSISFNKSQSMYPCQSEENTESDDFEEEDFNKEFDSPNDYYYYDDYDYEYYDDYTWENRENPCKREYYMQSSNKASRNVFASDLGIIAKGGDNNSITVAVTNLITTDCIADAEIEIYNFQNQLIKTGATNSDGFLTIDLENKPFLLVAKSGNQRGYLRLDDGSALSLSMFDIGGQESVKGVKGFIYGERGVWRPGDSLFISFILEDKNMVITNNQPVVFELFTPDNQQYLKIIKTNSVNGFYDFRTVTAPEAPTGNWMAKVKVGGASFTKTIKIETVKPNRLKINLDFGTKIIKSNEKISGKLSVKWLHGAIARNLKADVNLSIHNAQTSFENFIGYNFDDTIKKFNAEEELIFDGKINDIGEVLINPKFNVDENAPGMLNANFKIRAFEKGGDFSIDRMQLKYSPYKTYVGLKLPKGQGWNESLFSNEPNIIAIATVDEEGKPINRRDLKVEVYSISWRWWWEQDDDYDLSNLINSRSTSKILTDYVSTTDGKVLYEMNLNVNSWGRKLIRIIDPVSGHSCGQMFYTTYKGWWNGNGANSPGGAEMLSFSTDKKEYNVNEKVIITLPESKQGKALVSLETGSKIIKTFWVNIDNKNNTLEFETTKEMSPTVYASITYIQPHSQTDNNLPIRLYGVQAINVIDKSTKLEPVIVMPKVLEPEKKVTIKVKEANGKKMTYTVMVVDEGLLDLTRFKTPDAWKNFYQREALGIRTWDMYKYVLGAYSGEMAGLLAIGGDEDLINKGKEKANRFKPVVIFLGPFVLDASKENTHTFTMPNYIGSVRTMVVAGYQAAYGLAEVTTPVKKSLMVLATMPRVVGPNENVKLPVTVFAMDSKIKDVNVTVQTNNIFTVVGSKAKSINFKSEGEEVVYFDLKVARAVGVGTVKVIVESGKEKAEYDVELDVRVPNPIINKTIETVVEAGKTWTSDYEKIGINGTNKAVLEVSSIPPMNLSNRLQYLINYPHGCIEQTTSAVFPQLYLSSFVNLPKDEIAKIEENIKAGILRLKNFQLDNGGLTYWPGEDGIASDWGTNYAGHFLIEAKAKGYALPDGFLKSWIKFQKKQAADWSVNSNSTTLHYFNSSQLTQAYRLYTLALAGSPDIGAMNRLREVKDLNITAKWQLISAYYISGHKKVAKEMAENLEVNLTEFKSIGYTYGSLERDNSMILEALVTIKDDINSKHIFDDLSKDLNSNNWYSTQTTAYSLLAISKFIGDKSEGKMTYEFKANKGKEISVSTDKSVSNNELKFGESDISKLTFKNTSENKLFVKIHLEGLPLESSGINENNQLLMTINYTDLKGAEINPKLLKQGTDLVAEVIIKHPGIRSEYKDMALTQIFPSGWEIMNPRMDLNQATNLDIPTYQDIRDDRVYTYFDIKSGETKTFRILLNAAYVGKFYLPSVSCSAMYHKEISSSTSGQWVEVVE